MALSKLASYLEQCGIDNRQKEIFEKTPGMLQYYETIVDSIRNAMDEEESDDERPLIEQSMLTEAYGAIKEFVSAFDFDSADSVMATLKDYRVPENEKDRFDKLKSLLNEVNYDEILKLL